MPLARKYAGPRRPGERSAKVPKALKQVVPKSAKAKYALTKPATRAMKKLIDATNQTNELNSQAVTTGVGASYANHQFAGQPQNADLMRIFPRISQGVTREDRLGSKIKLTGNHLRFMFHIPPAEPSTGTPGNFNSALQCRLLVLSSKTFKKYTEVVANWTGGQILKEKYLRDGENVAYSQGDLFTLGLPVNTGLFTTHFDRKFILSRGVQVGGPTEGRARMPDVIKTINLNMKVKNKIVQWEDDNSSETNTYAPFAILLYAPINGGQSTTSPGPLLGNCFSKLNWKNM